MRFKFLLIPSVLLLQVADAQTNSASITTSQATVTTPSSAASSTPVIGSEPVSDMAAPTSTQTKIVDYKSVFESATVEEEVKIASERFSLTAEQQEMWLLAATDRRIAEKQAYDKLNSKDENYQRSAVYSGLRSALNTFHETIIGHLSPSQKQSLEIDRLIAEERRQRLLKVPPPPPPAPTITVAPVDSAAIKETEKANAKGKKAKKKKKPAG